MNYGFENEKFYVEYNSCRRHVLPFYEECKIRAKEIYEQNNTIILCLSSGLDSQLALHSFIEEGIKVQTFFLWMEGYNDAEFDQIKILNKKLNIKTEVIKLDPISLREELIDISYKFDTKPTHALHYKFVSLLPKEGTIVQAANADPWILSLQSNSHYIFHSFYDPEISRLQVLEKVERFGNIEFFGSSSEMLLSLLTDDITKWFLNSWKYFEKDFNSKEEKIINQLHRFDRYVKPFLYSKYWGDKLEYFPKFAGYENISWMTEEVNKYKKTKMCLIKYDILVDFLRNQNLRNQKFYENKISDLS